MYPSSLDVVRKFFGEDLNASHIDAVRGMPDEQVIELFARLNDHWVEWFANRFDKNIEPDRHYYVGEHVSAVDLLPLNTYKQLALYFPRIAVRDPLEAGLSTHCTTAQLFGQVLPAPLRADLLEGLTLLEQIAPLVRAGALDLVPTAQTNMTEGVQNLARQELDAAAAWGDKLSEEFAVVNGVCSMCGYWPVASTEMLWQRMDTGWRRLARELTSCHLPVVRAVATFNVPSVSRLAVADLIKLRADDAAFAAFREDFGVAMREALGPAAAGDEAFATEILNSRLRDKQDRCNQAAKRTSAFDGLILPACAALAVGGLTWAVGGVNPFSSLAQLQALLINAGAPGAAWYLADQWQRHGRTPDPRIAVYSALIDRAPAS